MSEAPPPLTTAERYAIRIRDQVDTDAEAAARLGISIHTLRKHLANVRSKLGVRSTSRAIREAAPNNNM